MFTNRHVAAFVLIGGATLSGCGGGGDADDEPATATDVAAGDDANAAVVITIADFAFEGVTEVAVGTTVTVTNDDSTTHTWTAVDGGFDSGALAPGESFEFTFSEAGSFDYLCNFHPSMTGTIVVTG
ncbi:MAG: cupredoxin domain-containing protein [Acidimicrobiia bacterium]